MHQMIVRSRFIALSLCFVSTISFANTFFGSGSSPGSAASATGTPPAAVMSPDQFSSRVKSLSQQTQNSLSKQATDVMKKPIPSAAGGQPGQPTAPSMDPNQASTQQAAAPQPSRATQPPPPPQSQPYSGFSGQSKTPTPSQPMNQPASSGKPGGWNIQY